MSRGRSVRSVSIVVVSDSKISSIHLFTPLLFVASSLGFDSVEKIDDLALGRSKYLLPIVLFDNLQLVKKFQVKKFQVKILVLTLNFTINCNAFEFPHF